MCTRVKISLRLVVMACMLAMGVLTQGQRLVFDRSAYITQTVLWRDVRVNGEVRLMLDGVAPSTLDVDRLQITLESLPSRTRMDTRIIQSVHVLDDSESHLVIKLRSKVPPNIFDDRLRVVVDASVPAAQTIEEFTYFEQMIDAMPKMIAESIAYEKTSKERHLFLGTAASIPAGGDGELAANGILYAGNPLRMSSPINQIEFNLDMDKGSDEKADPNFLTFGVSFRKIIPLQRRRTNAVRAQFQMASSRFQAMRGMNLASDDFKTERVEVRNLFNSTLEDVAALKQSFFREVVLTPLSPRPEMNFSGLRPGPVINFINTSDLQLRTSSKPFLSPNLSWSLKLVPIALESGITLRNTDNKDLQGSPIFRLNASAVAKIKFRFPCRDDLLADRIELEIKGTTRYLFNEESAFNPITKRNDLLVSGYKYYTQVDLRYVFGFRIPFPTSIFGIKLPNIQRKPAVALTYKNGFAPPVYGYNNAVGFRFTLASGDEDNSGDLQLSARDLAGP